MLILLNEDHFEIHPNYLIYIYESYLILIIFLYYQKYLETNHIILVFYAQANATIIILF